MFSLAVVVLFLAMMLASFTGLIAKDWSKENGRLLRQSRRSSPAQENLEAKAVTNEDYATKAPPVDLSDVDPLAPRYKEWEERAAKIAVTETKRAESLPFGGDKWGRDVLQKVIKGSEVSIFVGLTAAHPRHHHRHDAGRRWPATGAARSTTSSSGSTTSSRRSPTSC